MRTVLKDPLALMSAPWIFERISCDVIVTVRHPAAFVASLKLKDWKFPFDHLLKQPKLMERYLSKYKEQIVLFSEKEFPIIKQGTLLWNILYSIVFQHQKHYKSQWYFVRHEDLSINPLAEFKEIFQFLNIDFSESVKNKIIATTTTTEATKLERDSKANISTWTKRLDTSEIKYVKEHTQEVWEHFYSEEDWFGF
jgi:hypothetical protein